MVSMLGRLMTNQLIALTKWCERQTPPERRTPTEIGGSSKPTSQRTYSERRDGWQKTRDLHYKAMEEKLAHMQPQRILNRWVYRNPVPRN